MQESRRQRTSRLLRISWSVMREDRRLLVFPIVSATVSLLVGGGSFVLARAVAGGPEAERRVFLIGGIVASYPATFAALFCGVALAAVLARRLDGEDARPADGWRVARERIGVIAAWTLVTCTVGALLRLLDEHLPLGGRVAGWILGLSWSLATLLAVPVLAYEGLGPRATFRRSVELFRHRWAEQALGAAGIGAGFVVVVVPCMALLGIGAISDGAAAPFMVALGGGGLLAALAVQTAMDQVFRVFVYRSALGLDRGDGPFPAADLTQPFEPPRGGAG
jgi:Family of unknown function (DUF6159)